MSFDIDVPGHVRVLLKGDRSALKSLGKLERIIAEGRTPPARFLKPSGHGSTGTFEPYEALGLHHAKLDFSGQNKGNPLLVFQRSEAGQLVAFAVTTHRDYASVDHARCRSWLWEHRDDIRWDMNERTAAILDELTAEFGGTEPSTGRR